MCDARTARDHLTRATNPLLSSDSPRECLGTLPCRAVSDAQRTMFDNGKSVEIVGSESHRLTGHRNVSVRDEVIAVCMNAHARLDRLREVKREMACGGCLGTERR